MKHISNMGGIWRLSEKAYRRLLKDIKEGKNVDLDDYGKLVLTDPTNLEDIQYDPEMYS